MARRGENIRKRKDGRWEGRYIKGRTPDGKAKLGYVYGKTYGQVRQRLVQYRAQCGELILSAENPTFGQLAQDWLNSLGSSVKKSTAVHYGYTLGIFCRNCRNSGCILWRNTFWKPRCFGYFPAKTEATAPWAPPLPRSVWHSFAVFANTAAICG